jgi:hypothetical protein
VFSRFHARSGALGVRSDNVERDWRTEGEEDRCNGRGAEAEGQLARMWDTWDGCEEGDWGSIGVDMLSERFSEQYDSVKMETRVSRKLSVCGAILWWMHV